MYELKHNKTLNWDIYSSQFPARYQKETKLDFELHKIVSTILEDKQWYRILDVGGGPNYTPALRRLFEQSKHKDVRVTIDLLDPFVVPLVIKGSDIETRQVDWDYIIGKVANRNRNSDPGYDLIVCRGALNYLTLQQIDQLGYSLREGGLFIANSFMDPHEVTRDIVTGGGDKGKEEATYRKEGDQIIMTHRLYVNGEMVEHESYYHNPLDVMRRLGPDGSSMECYGINSILYKLQK